MKFSLAMLGSVLASAVDAKSNFRWPVEPNLCLLPEGPYKDKCMSVSIEYCDNYNIAGQNPCYFQADCTYENTTVHNAFLLPMKVTFFNTTLKDGVVTQPGLDTMLQCEAEPIECNPCKLPQGNYDESCFRISIRYLEWLKDSATPCLFKTDCDIGMYRISEWDKKWNALPTQRLKHNEYLLPKHVIFSDVRNLDGKIIHRSDAFDVADVCYEAGSTDLVAVGEANAASASQVSTAVTAVAAVGMALAIH